MDKKSIWKVVIQTLVTILTAIGTTLGITSPLPVKTGRAARRRRGGRGVYLPMHHRILIDYQWFVP